MSIKFKSSLYLNAYYTRPSILLLIPPIFIESFLNDALSAIVTHLFRAFVSFSFISLDNFLAARHFNDSPISWVLFTFLIVCSLTLVSLLEDMYTRPSGANFRTMSLIGVRFIPSSLDRLSSMSLLPSLRFSFRIILSISF